MSSEIRNRLSENEALLAGIREATHFETLAKRMDTLEQEMGRAGFWSSPESAAKVIAELKRIKAVVTDIRALENRLADTRALFDLSLEANDKDSLDEADRESSKLLADTRHLELNTLLSGDYDSCNCFVAIHAGAGGTDACDWVAILLRMYLRWAERDGYRAKILDELAGDEAGIKSVTFHVTGDWAYGYLRSEIGVHRLVRISPFALRDQRHTSFASVRVFPEVSDEIDIQVNPADLRVDTYRSSGAGGQHVNVTDSAIRITHLPSGIVVQCQNERSQHSNRAQAMKVLKSRLLQLEVEKRENTLSKIAGEKRDIDFGSQIRSYVLHPYRLAKDHRTDVETSNVDAVLDGGLEIFIEAYLRQAAKGRSTGAPPAAEERAAPSPAPPAAGKN